MNSCELGPDEYFDADGLTFVEWADRVEHLLPEDRVEIELEVTGDTKRRVTLVGTSARFERAVEQIRCRF